MKTLIVINDGSPEAAHAARLAFGIAQKMIANLILANIFARKNPVAAKTLVMSGSGVEDKTVYVRAGSLAEYLAKANSESSEDFKPGILHLEASDFSVNDMVNYINQNQIWMIVKGVGEGVNKNQAYLASNIQSVLNRVMCPLLLVPEKYKIRDFERLVYMADLRYCQVPVVKYMAQLAAVYEARLQVAHVPAKGLPEMEENYSRTVFNDAISVAVRYPGLFFNNIRERDLKKVADVLVNGMHSDMLVLVNHQSHFEELMGRYLTDVLPEYITVPMLVFPF